MKIFSLNKSDLSKKILQNFQSEEIDNQLKIDKFSDGEFCPFFKKSIRGENVFIIADGHTSDDIIKLLLVIDASKRSGATKINVIYPYVPYSRSDKMDSLRTTIGAKLLSDVLQVAGISNLICIDLHSESISGFYNIPVIHLSSGRIFIDYIKSLNIDNICFTAPDAGASKRNQRLAKAFYNSTNATINKTRNIPNEVAKMELIGSVKDKNVIIYDDMSDTFGTISKASKLIMDNGALSVRAVITHGVLSEGSLENIANSQLTELIISDTVSLTYDKIKKYELIQSIKPKITVISCSDILIKSIYSLLTNNSINEINSI